MLTHLWANKKKYAVLLAAVLVAGAGALGLLPDAVTKPLLTLFGY